MDMPEVFVDVRESRQLYSKLSKLVDIRFKRLRLGDVVSGQICIERKSLSGFFTSLRSGRIFNQVHDMLYSFDYPYLVIEGKFYTPYFYDEENFDQDEKARDTLDSFFDFLVKYSRKLPVLRVERYLYSYLVFRIITQKESKLEMPIVKREGRTRDEISEDILCSLPGIGRSRARKILSHYKTVEHFLSDEKDAIPGVGRLNVYRKYFR